MPKLTETELLERDSHRDLNAELLESIDQLRLGQIGRVSVVTRNGRVIESPIAKTRVAASLSQVQFAQLLGVSVRTLQDWEQCRRSPSGAAKTLLRIAEKHPDFLRELVI
jgi:putative transcriptional regulator